MPAPCWGKQNNAQFYVLCFLNDVFYFMEFSDLQMLQTPTQPSGQVVQAAAAPKLCSVGERPQVEPLTGGSQRPQGLMVESPSQYQEVWHLWQVVRSTDNDTHQ